MCGVIEFGELHITLIIVNPRFTVILNNKVKYSNIRYLAIVPLLVYSGNNRRLKWCTVSVEITPGWNNRRSIDGAMDRRGAQRRGGSAPGGGGVSLCSARGNHCVYTTHFRRCIFSIHY